MWRTTVALIVILQANISRQKDFDASINLNSLAFGSCSGIYDRPTPIFEDIAKEDADVWLWLGDVAYIDTKVGPSVYVNSSKEHVKAGFTKAKSDRFYQEMIRKFQILGIWDDHDFNQNNGNKSNPTKDWVQQLFLEYLDEPKESPRWNQKGLYTSYTYGDRDHRVRLILLDSRYFSDSRYAWKADNLGDVQWNWLEDQLKEESDAVFTFICFSIQFLPQDAPVTTKVTPYTYSRILGLLAKYQLEGVVILSGDVHFAQVMRSPCAISPMKYRLHEFTSSGLSHHAYEHMPFAKRLLPAFRPNTWDWTPLHSEFNYGMINFDWSDPENPKLDLIIKGLEGEVIDHVVLEHADLRVNTNVESCEQLGISLNPWFLFIKKIWDSLFYPSRLLTVVITFLVIIILPLIAIALLLKVLKLLCWKISRKNKFE